MVQRLAIRIREWFDESKRGGEIMREFLINHGWIPYKNPSRGKEGVEYEFIDDMSNPGPVENFLDIRLIQSQYELITKLSEVRDFQLQYFH